MPPLAAVDSVWMSTAFEKALSRASARAYEEVWRKVGYWTEVHLRNPGDLHKSRKVEHLAGRGIDVYEIDTGRVGRVLADYSSGRLALLRMGEKPIVPHYSASMRTRDLGTLSERPFYQPPIARTRRRQGSPATPAGEPGMVAHRAEPNDLTYDEADNPAWTYCLDEEQGVAADLILDAARNAGGAKQKQRILLVGPPGTGKTAILLNLLVRAASLRIDAKIKLSSQVAAMTEMSGVSLDGRLWSTYDKKPGGLLLLDDPEDEDVIRDTFKAASSTPIIVAAFDPLQMKPSRDGRAFTDQSMRDLRRWFRAEAIELRQCYRQRKVLGEAAKETLDVLAASSPYYSADKTRDFHAARTEIVSLANALEFVYPGGETTTHTGVTRKRAEEIVRPIADGPLWAHAPGLLVVIEEDTRGMHWPWAKWLAGTRHAIVGSKDTASIKGLEFQHVILVLGEHLYEQTQSGFEGKNTRTYESRKLLRIPFTRARDSLTTMVVDDYGADEKGRESALAKRSLFWDHQYTQS